MQHREPSPRGYGAMNIRDWTRRKVELAKRYLLTQEAERLREQGMELDDILRNLRARGCSKGQSVAIIAGLREYGPSRLAQAKRLVHDSATWADAKARDEMLDL